MPTFAIQGDQFRKDGSPLRVLSGALHYFRVLPQQWPDRLAKLRAMGLNTVETYTAWNLHEPSPGKFDFSAMLDVAAFARLAGDMGLNVIVRPGPYICAEWDMGGLPAWLLSDPEMQLRCHYPNYLAAVERYFEALCAQLAPLQCTRGGPILAVQVENEYGSFGNDSAYLRWIEAVLRARGIDVLLFTSDGPGDEYLQCGTLPHLFKTANFGSRPAEAFAKLRQYQPDGPLMCMEYWNGWFDHWGEPHHTRPAADAAAVLDEMLAGGASVNLYMFHGGTNFGLTSGANEAPYPDYQATVTGYDYDAPLNEAGDPTEKYAAFREVIRRYAPVPDATITARPKLPLTPAHFHKSAALFDSLDSFGAPVASANPLPLELLPPDCTGGSANAAFVLYRAQIHAPLGSGTLILENLHDRAQVFVDGAPLGVLEREHHQETLDITIPQAGAQLDILVENMGRVNFGPHLIDRKGLLGGARIDQRALHGWQTWTLLAGYLPGLPQNLPWRAALPSSVGPAFYCANFHVDSVLDGYLALPGWTKGLAWVNGFCLGRYWSRGPQQTLFVPAPLLRKGRNELILLELHQPGEDALFGAPIDLG